MMNNKRKKYRSVMMKLAGRDEGPATVAFIAFILILVGVAIGFILS